MSQFPSNRILSAHRPQAITALERYWRQIRGARILPVRSEVDPSQIDTALPHAFITERLAPGVTRMPACGQRLNDMIHADGRGMPLSTFFTLGARSELVAEVELAFNGPALVKIPLAAELDADREIGRLLLLPLEGANGAVDRLVGAIVMHTPARRLAIRRDGYIRRELLAPVARPALPLDNMKEKGPQRLRPALRLVVSND